MCRPACVCDLPFLHFSHSCPCGGSCYFRSLFILFTFLLLLVALVVDSLCFHSFLSPNWSTLLLTTKQRLASREEKRRKKKSLCTFTATQSLKVVFFIYSLYFKGINGISHYAGFSALTTDYTTAMPDKDAAQCEREKERERTNTKDKYLSYHLGCVLFLLFRTFFPFDKE